MALCHRLIFCALDIGAIEINNNKSVVLLPREEVQDGIKWEYEIKTHDTKVWHVTEFSAQELDSSSYGHFHSDDTYVVRWHYSIHQIGKTNNYHLSAYFIMKIKLQDNYDNNYDNNKSLESLNRIGTLRQFEILRDYFYLGLKV